MFAQLGDHIFQGLKTPVSTSEADAVKYGQIPRVNDKDAIQPTGAELREISLTIMFSSEFCDPQTEIFALKKSMHAFEVLPYITGDGRIVGKFVITNLDIANQQCTADGWVELATVTVNLLESPGEEEAAPTGRALSSQKPIASAPGRGRKQAIAKVKSRTTSLKRGVREVRQLATDAQGLYASAKTKVAATEKIIKRAGQLPTSLDEALAYAENLSKIDNVADVSVLEMNVGQLSASADKVTTSATPVAGFAGTKEGGN